MRVFLTTVGTRGDVEPYVALGVGLREAGHAALSTASRFEAFVTGHGLDFAPTTSGLIDLLSTDLGRDAVESMTNVWEMAKRVRALVRETGPLQQDLIAESWAAAEAVRPDLIVYHPKAYWGPAFADALGARAVLAPLQPMFVPTGEWPSIGFPALRLGAGYNRSTHRLVRALTKLGTDRYLGPWLRDHGVPRRPRGATVLDTPRGEPIPVALGISPLVIPEPADWPAHVAMTGFWALPPEAGYTPPAALAAFLDAGPPPVYVGFGSMAGRDPARTTRTVVEALGQAGVRGIVASGWGGLDASDLPETLFRLEAAPHAWLFPQCAAVVHHGGAGTTAAGLRAGRPTVICPFFGDQPFWGRHVHRLGVGAEPILQKRLTAERLAAAIREVTASGPIRERAVALGAALRAEDGVGNAVRFLEGVA